MSELPFAEVMKPSLAKNTASALAGFQGIGLQGNACMRKSPRIKRGLRYGVTPLSDASHILKEM